MFASGMRKLIFNQNTYYTFRHFGLDPLVLPPYDHSDVIGALVVSEDNQRYLQYAFPNLKCERLILSLNFNVFDFVPWGEKRRQIAYMTRKNEDDVAQVVKILAGRDRLLGWQLVPIQGLSEREVARVMGESRLFLAFGHPEGLSLSNLEALACGCRLIGYSGRAGREYFDPTGSIEVEVGDILGFCKAVEDFIAHSEFNEVENAHIAQSAASFVRQAYSGASERDSVVSAMHRFLAAAQTSFDQASP